MTKNPYEIIVLELRAGIQSSLDAMEEARKNEAESRLAHMRAEQRLKDIQRDLIISASESMGTVNDPKTGRPNEPWGKLMVEQQVQANKKWQDAYAEFMNAEAGYANWSVQLANAVERLGAFKSIARLYAGLMSVAGG